MDQWATKRCGHWRPAHADGAPEQLKRLLGTVVGLMPHPEHAVDPLFGPTTDGKRFFESALKGVLAA